MIVEDANVLLMLELINGRVIGHEFSGASFDYGKRQGIVYFVDETTSIEVPIKRVLNYKLETVDG